MDYGLYSVSAKDQELKQVKTNSVCRCPRKEEEVTPSYTPFLHCPSLAIPSLFSRPIPSFPSLLLPTPFLPLLFPFPSCFLLHPFSTPLPPFTLTYCSTLNPVTWSGGAVSYQAGSNAFYICDHFDSPF